MTVIDEHGRPEPPLASGELETLTGFLDFQRATLVWKTDGLDAEQLRQKTAASTMTLAGIVKHLALVESYWFRERLLGESQPSPFAEADWESDRDWEWTSAAMDTPEQLRALWLDAVERSREIVATAAAQDGLERLLAVPWPDGTRPSLRWVLVHMIEEYARHNGHADLLREAIDGATGE